jgi:hypothetical protein
VVESFSISVQEIYLFLPEIVLKDGRVTAFELQQHLHVNSRQVLDLEGAT